MRTAKAAGQDECSSLRGFEDEAVGKQVRPTSSLFGLRVFGTMFSGSLGRPVKPDFHVCLVVLGTHCALSSVSRGRGHGGGESLKTTWVCQKLTQSCKFESAAVKSEFRNLPTKRTITSFVFGQVQVDWKMSDQKHVQLHVFFKHVMLHVARSRQDALVVSSTRFCCHMMFATEPTKVLFVQEDHKSITTSLNRLQASGNSATVHLCLLNHCVLYCQLADRSSRRSMSRKKGAPLLHNKLKSTKALLCMYNDITKASRKCKGYVCRLK